MGTADVGISNKRRNHFITTPLEVKMIILPDNPDPDPAHKITSNEMKLRWHILERSNAQDWENALKEWRVTGFRDEEYTHCPCGQQIVERCFLLNIDTQIEIFVGNVCVQKFMGVEIKEVLSPYKKLLKAPETTVISPRLVKFASDNGYLYGNEEFFLMSIQHKKHLSPAQLSWLKKINHRIINRTKVT